MAISYESSERKGDTLISVEWHSNGQKKWESKTVDGKNTYKTDGMKMVHT